MDKENIRSYLSSARQLMREGKFIEAYETVGFVLKCISDDLKGDNSEVER